jgi:hypothetical protein
MCEHNAKMPGAAGSAKEFQAVAAWFVGIFTGRVVGIGGWRGMDIGCGATGGFGEGPGVARRDMEGDNMRAARWHRAALMCTFSRFISAFPCFTSTFPRSGPIHASGFPAASRMITIPIVFIRPHEPGMKSSPIPAFPLRGRGATFRTIDRDRRCPVPRLFSNSPSSLLE